MTPLSRAAAIAILALFLLAACQTPAPVRTPTPVAVPPTPTATAVPPAPAATATAPADGRTTLVLETATGRQVEVQAELAINPEQRARGLMFRETLAEGTGMLFVFPADTMAGFWMQNTKVPLSIAFIAADGAIVGLDDMEPLTTDSHAPPVPYRYALEVPQSFFARLGVATGDAVLFRAGAEVRPLAQLPASRDAR